MVNCKIQSDHEFIYYEQIEVRMEPIYPDYL